MISLSHFIANLFFVCSNLKKSILGGWHRGVEGAVDGAQELAFYYTGNNQKSTWGLTLKRTV